MSRCHRKGQECTPAKSVRRRNQGKPIIARTARLEAKLDGLVSILSAGASSGVANATPVPAATPDNLTLPGIIHIKVNPPATDNESGRNSQSSNSSVHNPEAPVSTTATTPSTYSSYELSHAEAEEYLANFQINKLKFFPFIFIPSATRSQQLRRERPFLWLCIMFVGSKSRPQQQILASMIRQRIAQEMVVEAASSIDLLLGTLAFIAW